MKLKLERPENMSRTEFQIIAGLLQEAADRGYKITVWDSAYDEYADKVVHRSKDYPKIFEAMHSGESATLEFFDGQIGLGTAIILWGEGDTIISDYSYNPEMNSLIETAEAA
tara:strand:- start:301 stop:636 length:336 start_codon:yes stop_codon:yes gene_type:complete